MKILIDNGHGENTPGKCSPDRRLKEWKYNREIATEVADRLQKLGIDAELIVTETKDIALTERVRRVNSFCDRLGKDNVVLVSIHVNAAGNGGWFNARGWSGWVAVNASRKSKRLAQILYRIASDMELKGNRCVPPEKYWTANFTIIAKTKCPAVLTENLFQDNREDVDFLLSNEGREKITSLHVEGIKEFILSV